MVKDSDSACCNSRAPHVAHSRAPASQLVTMALICTEAWPKAVTVTGASAGHSVKEDQGCSQQCGGTRMEVAVAWHRDLTAPGGLAGHLMK